MKAKKKTLPKNFDELIRENDIENLKRVFDTCDINARGGYGKSTALSYTNIPDEFVWWLVENGADMEAVDIYHCTALHRRAASRRGNVGVFLKLGANIHATDKEGDTPLHFAAGSSYNVSSVMLLLQHGASAKAVNSNGETPLEYAIRRASNIYIINLAKISKILLTYNNEITQKMRDYVRELGESFEFHRENFNKEHLQETDDALNSLYEMFGVKPVKRRVMHDNVSPILVSSTTWQKQFEELWFFLIPSNGSAKTVQGEVIRIAGKVRDEIYRNGGCNWNIDFKKMLDAFLIYLSSGNALSNEEIGQVNSLVKDIRKSGDAEVDELHFLCELATKWVLLNPSPISVQDMGYKR